MLWRQQEEVGKKRKLLIRMKYNVKRSTRSNNEERENDMNENEKACLAVERINNNKGRK